MWNYCYILFVIVQSTTSQHCFRISVKQAPSHYLNHYWLIAVTWYVPPQLIYYTLQMISSLETGKKMVIAHCGESINDILHMPQQHCRTIYPIVLFPGQVKVSYEQSSFINIIQTGQKMLVSEVSQIYKSKDTSSPALLMFMSWHVHNIIVTKCIESKIQD